MSEGNRHFEPHEQAKRSIQKKYRKSIWNPFTTAVKRYSLIEPGDRVAACISGGKDSMLMAKLLQMLHEHSDVPFELTFLCMDPGYNAENRAKIEYNAKLLDIPLTIFETNIFDVANAAGKSPCYLCARMRRGHLYNKAREMGCNKIALGHHFSDVIETTVMGMFWGAQIQAMPPKLWSTNFEGMQLIRPLYMVREDDIISWARYNNLDFIRCACRFTENSADNESVSKRLETKNLIKALKKDNPDIEKSIFNSIHSVQLDTMVGYKTGGKQYDFDELFSVRGRMKREDREE